MWRRLPWWPRQRGVASLRWETYGRLSVPPHDSHRCSSYSLPQAPPSQYLRPSHLWSCCWSEWTRLLESWRWWNGPFRRPAAFVRRPAESWRLPLSCHCCKSVGWVGKKGGEMGLELSRNGGRETMWSTGTEEENDQNCAAWRCEDQKREKSQ